MRSQSTIGHEIVSDFFRDEADGPAQLDVGQSFLAQVVHGLRADPEVFGHVEGRPPIRFGRRRVGVPGNLRSFGATGIFERVHNDDFEVIWIFELESSGRVKSSFAE